MGIQLACNFCRNTSELTTNQLRDFNYEDVVFTVFTCPKCNKSKVVQVDNEKTYELLKQYKSCYKKAAYGLKRGQSCSQKLQNKAHNLKSKLDYERNLLNTKYSGLFTEFEDNKEQSELM